MESSHDVVVVGSGPAGWATAVACSEAGLHTILIAPEPTAPWPATYGAWADELDALGFGHVGAQKWPTISATGRTRHVLARSYARVDNAALFGELFRRGSWAGLALEVGRIVGVRHDRTDSTVLTSDARSVVGRVVLDASGAASVLSGSAGVAKAWQWAYGIVATPSEPIDPTGCVLMDFSGTRPDGAPPSFLYAQQWSSDRWFLEETVLASRTEVSAATLRRSLHHRMAQRGIELCDIVEHEVVRIPMGLRVPSPGRIVALGAAGGGIHPVTGYSLTASLRAAPLVATAIAQALQRRATVEAVSAAAWAARSTPAHRRARSLQEYGLDVMLRMDLAGQQQFFDEFFSLSPDQIDRYLGDSSGATEVAAVMRAVWAKASSDLRRSLATGDPRVLARVLRRSY